MEITARTDLGADLNCPTTDERGREYWSYSLINEVSPGDTVLHYWKPMEAIVATSVSAGGAWPSEVVWGAQGTSARGLGVEPYRRPGWRVSLEHYAALETPVELGTLRANESAVLAIRAKIEADYGKPTYFPFVPYSGQGLRTAQAYLTKVPRSLVQMLPPDLEGASRISREVRAGAGKIGKEYRRAPRTTIEQTTDPWLRDPALVDRALAAHAEIQDSLADHLSNLGIEPRSPAPGEPDFDLAWERDAVAWVAEVKSLTTTNEEKQLRLGLGQVLRYRHALGARAVLAIERKPSDHRWLDLCDDLGVMLVWPDWKGVSEVWTQS